MILKLVLRCDWKLFVARIQTRNMNLLSSTYFWNLVARLLVECNILLMSICWFHWSKISFKFFTLAFFCWLLTCVYFIYCIRAHWSWNWSSSMIASCLCNVSRPDLIISPRRFVDDCGKSAIFSFTYHHQYIELLQVNYLKFYLLSLVKCLFSIRRSVDL